MARRKGTFQVSANYEPLKAAPFDARQLVETRADLIAEDTWVINDIAWVYTGMIVAVASDVNRANNGVYVLTDAANYTSLESWEKLADSKSIEDLQRQIDAIEVQGGGTLDLEIDSEADLPEVGDEHITYYIKENSSIQRWDAEEGKYRSYGGTDFDINIIHGGDSNGN